MSELDDNLEIIANLYKNCKKTKKFYYNSCLIYQNKVVNNLDKYKVNVGLDLLK